MAVGQVLRNLPVQRNLSSSGSVNRTKVAIGDTTPHTPQPPPPDHATEHQKEVAAKLDPFSQVDHYDIPAGKAGGKSMTMDEKNRKTAEGTTNISGLLEVLESRHLKKGFFFRVSRKEEAEDEIGSDYDEVDPVERTREGWKAKSRKSVTINPKEEGKITPRDGAKSAASRWGNLMNQNVLSSWASPLEAAEWYFRLVEETVLERVKLDVQMDSTDTYVSHASSGSRQLHACESDLSVRAILIRTTCEDVLVDKKVNITVWKSIALLCELKRTHITIVSHDFKTAFVKACTSNHLEVVAFALKALSELTQMRPESEAFKPFLALMFEGNGDNIMKGIIYLCGQILANPDQYHVRPDGTVNIRFIRGEDSDVIRSLWSILDYLSGMRHYARSLLHAGGVEAVMFLLEAVGKSKRCSARYTIAGLRLLQRMHKTFFDRRGATHTSDILPCERPWPSTWIRQVLYVIDANFPNYHVNGVSDEDVVRQIKGEIVALLGPLGEGLNESMDEYTRDMGSCKICGRAMIERRLYKHEYFCKKVFMTRNKPMSFTAKRLGKHDLDIKEMRILQNERNKKRTKDLSKELATIGLRRIQTRKSTEEYPPLQPVPPEEMVRCLLRYPWRNKREALVHCIRRDRAKHLRRSGAMWDVVSSRRSSTEHSDSDNESEASVDSAAKEDEEYQKRLDREHANGFVRCMVCRDDVPADVYQTHRRRCLLDGGPLERIHAARASAQSVPYYKRTDTSLSALFNSMMRPSTAPAAPMSTPPPAPPSEQTLADSTVDLEPGETTLNLDNTKGSADGPNIDATMVSDGESRFGLGKSHIRSVHWNTGPVSTSDGVATILRDRSGAKVGAPVYSRIDDEVLVSLTPAEREDMELNAPHAIDEEFGFPTKVHTNKQTSRWDRKMEDFDRKHLTTHPLGSTVNPEASKTQSQASHTGVPGGHEQPLLSSMDTTNHNAQRSLNQSLRLNSKGDLVSRGLINSSTIQWSTDSDENEKGPTVPPRTFVPPDRDTSRHEPWKTWDDTSRRNVSSFNRVHKTMAKAEHESKRMDDAIRAKEEQEKKEQLEAKRKAAVWSTEPPKSLKEMLREEQEKVLRESMKSMITPKMELDHRAQAAYQYAKATRPREPERLLAGNLVPAAEISRRKNKVSQTVVGEMGEITSDKEVLDEYKLRAAARPRRKLATKAAHVQEVNIDEEIRKIFEENEGKPSKRMMATKNKAKTLAEKNARSHRDPAQLAARAKARDANGMMANGLLREIRCMRCVYCGESHTADRAMCIRCSSSRQATLSTSKRSQWDDTSTVRVERHRRKGFGPTHPFNNV